MIVLHLARFLLFFVVFQGNGHGEAPADTLDPQACLRKLLDQFLNCKFAAKQTLSIFADQAEPLIEHSEVMVWVNRDAMVTQCRARTEATVLNGVEAPESIRHTESRWYADELSLSVNIQDKWPMLGLRPDDFTVNGVLAMPKQDGDLNMLWGNLVVRNFAESNQTSAVRFIDMMDEGGKHGYRMDHVAWADAEHSSIRYRYASADFGVTEFTFSLFGDKWQLVGIRVVKEADDKIYAIDQPGEDRLKNSFASPYFPQRHKGIDRLQVDYKIGYSGTSETPKSIVRSESQSLGSRKASLESALEFQSFESGGVSLDEVNAAALPLLDGTRVLYADDELGKIAWVIQDGKVVREVNVQALATGRNAFFNLASRPGQFVIAIVVIGCLVVVISHYRNKQAEAQS